MSIKAGDLVMVVRPTSCCGNSESIGLIFAAIDVVYKQARCRYCNHDGITTHAVISGNVGVDIARLKKIDPPADGDSLPTRRDLEVAA